MTAPVAALTGASGFLGRRLARSLDLKGWRVRVLVRRPLDTALWEGPEPERVEGDLSQAGALERLVTGCSLVIHCAGAVSAPDRRAFFAVNAEGARAMADTVAHAPAARMVLVSSLAAREPQLSAYAASKRAGEDAARAILPPERLRVVRPPAIFGPGDRATLDIFKLALHWPILPVLDAPSARMALAHVDDVAACVLHAGLHPQGQPVSAVGGARPDGYSWRELMDAVSTSVGRTPRLMPIPGWPLRLAGAATASGARLLGRSPVFSPGKAREMLHPDWSVRPQELALGAPQAHFGLQEGLADTVSWYRARGWL